MLNNDEMNQYQNERKKQVDKKYKNMQRQIKQAQVTKSVTIGLLIHDGLFWPDKTLYFRVKMVQTNSNNREKYRMGETDIEERLKVLENEIVEKKKKLRSDGDLLMTIKKGICSLGSKLCWIDVPELRDELTVSDIIMNINMRYFVLFGLFEAILKFLRNK